MFVVIKRYEVKDLPFWPQKTLITYHMMYIMEWFDWDWNQQFRFFILFRIIERQNDMFKRRLTLCDRGQPVLFDIKKGMLFQTFFVL